MNLELRRRPLAPLIMVTAAAMVFTTLLITVRLQWAPLESADHRAVAAQQDDAPSATDAERGWREILLAAALQGAIFAVVRAAVDRAAATGTHKLTGVWPGEEGQPAGEARDLGRYPYVWHTGVGERPGSGSRTSASRTWLPLPSRSNFIGTGMDEGDPGRDASHGNVRAPVK
jgi:Protein of unknown function (DUF4235)